MKFLDLYRTLKSRFQNKYGLFTIQGFYQNSIIEPSSTEYQYPIDTNYYTTWVDFLTAKEPETGGTGEHWDENWLGSYQATPGTDISLSTSYYNTTASVELSNTAYTVIESKTPLPSSAEINAIN